MAVMESNDEDSLKVLKDLIILNLNNLLNLNIDLTRDLVLILIDFLRFKDFFLKPKKIK